jgi:hypothetical protein
MGTPRRHDHRGDDHQVVSELEAHRTGDCTDGPSAPLTSTADDPRHELLNKGWLANQDTQGSRMSEGGGSRKGWLANQDTQGLCTGSRTDGNDGMSDSEGGGSRKGVLVLTVLGLST